VAFRPSPTQAWPIGARGHAIEPLNPSGYVRVRGELWKAEAFGPAAQIPAGSPVVVREGRGLTLLVDPVVESSAGGQ